METRQSQTQEASEKGVKMSKKARQAQTSETELSNAEATAVADQSVPCSSEDDPVAIGEAQTVETELTNPDAIELTASEATAMVDQPAPSPSADDPVAVGESMAGLKSRPLVQNPPIPVEPQLRMTRERWEAEHGIGVNVGHNGNRMVYPDGSWSTHDSLAGTTFHPPASNPQDLAADLLSFSKARLRQAEKALVFCEHARAASWTSGPGVMTFQGRYNWQGRELGSMPAALRAGDGSLRIDAAISWLTSLVQLRRKLVRQRERELLAVNPALTLPR